MVQVYLETEQKRENSDAESIRARNVYFAIDHVMHYRTCTTKLQHLRVPFTKITHGKFYHEIII